MKVFLCTLDGNKSEILTPDNFLGWQIEIDGYRYSLEDREGALDVRAVDAALVVLPRASNAIEIIPQERR